MTKVTQFEIVHFKDAFKQEDGKLVDREVLLLYGLGEDGIIYEMALGKWLALPITKENMREIKP